MCVDMNLWQRPHSIDVRVIMQFCQLFTFVLFLFVVIADRMF